MYTKAETGRNKTWSLQSHPLAIIIWAWICLNLQNSRKFLLVVELKTSLVKKGVEIGSILRPFIDKFSLLHKQK